MDQSGSAALFGIVSALAFLPMVVMSPSGGIVADRTNKQRIMVVLDFFTAAIIFGFILINGKVALAPLVVVVLMLLYGIQGAYSPAVQASIPLLASESQLVAASCACFVFSAVMELFIQIPHTPREAYGSVWGTVRTDMAESFGFIIKEKPVIAKAIGVIFAFNLFMITMLLLF